MVCDNRGIVADRLRVVFKPGFPVFLDQSECDSPATASSQTLHTRQFRSSFAHVTKVLQIRAVTVRSSIPDGRFFVKAELVVVDSDTSHRHASTTVGTQPSPRSRPLKLLNRLHGAGDEMKTSALALSCLFLVLNVTDANAQCGCDQAGTACDTKCSCCDDRGLLDIADSLLGRLGKIQVGSRKSQCDTAPSCGCPSASSCDCGPAPSCGCESAPSCGCGPAPSCGCESAPSCQCSSPAPMNGASRSISAPDTRLTTINPPVPTINSDQSRYGSDAAPKPPTVAPQRVPKPVPVGDEDVNPFLDDSAGRLRKVPARVINFQKKKAESYGETYDPQANLYISPASQKRLTDRVNYSSRNRHTTRGLSGEPAPVVTASATRLPRRAPELPNREANIEPSQPKPELVLPGVALEETGRETKPAPLPAVTNPLR